MRSLNRHANILKSRTCRLFTTGFFEQMSDYWNEDTEEMVNKHVIYHSTENSSAKSAGVGYFAFKKRRNILMRAEEINIACLFIRLRTNTPQP